MASKQCSVCKAMGYECKATCVFAEHFPSTNPQRFENVQRIFGATNVYKFLEGVNDEQRRNAATALCYEAEARMNDPINGVAGMVLHKERHLKSVKSKIELAKKELETIVEPNEVPPYVNLPIPDDFLAPLSSSESINRDEDMSDSHGGASSSAALGSSNSTKNIPP